MSLSTSPTSSYAPRTTSPLSSPTLSPPSATASFPNPTLSSASSPSSDFPRRASHPSTSSARSSSPSFPRSKPLRPIASALCMSSMSASAGPPGMVRRKSDEPRPVNWMMKPNRGNGKVKMLVSGRSMNSFELNLSGRELARAE